MSFRFLFEGALTSLKCERDCHGGLQQSLVYEVIVVEDGELFMPGIDKFLDVSSKFELLIHNFTVNFM